MKTVGKYHNNITKDWIKLKYKFISHTNIQYYLIGLVIGDREFFSSYLYITRRYTNGRKFVTPDNFSYLNYWMVFNFEI